MPRHCGRCDLVAVCNSAGLCAVCVFEAEHAPRERVRLMAEGEGPVLSGEWRVKRGGARARLRGSRAERSRLALLDRGVG